MSEKLKVVVDTSVFVSAFKNSQPTSSPKKIINKWLEDEFLLIMTPQIQEEIAKTFIKVGINEIITENLITAIEQNAAFYPGLYKVSILDKIDPNDNIIFAAALESKADYIISLDKAHILPFKNYNLIGKTTQIVNPNIFLRQFEGDLLQEKKLELEIKNLIINKISLKI